MDWDINWDYLNNENQMAKKMDIHRRLGLQGLRLPRIRSPLLRGVPVMGITWTPQKKQDNSPEPI